MARKVAGRDNVHGGDRSAMQMQDGRRHVISNRVRGEMSRMLYVLLYSLLVSKAGRRSDTADFFFPDNAA